MIVAENILVMLLTEAKLQSFIPKGICNATTSTEVLVDSSFESREKVGAMVRRAAAAGGTTYNEPQDVGRGPS
jgi:predicted lactoylglutathione lyase